METHSTQADQMPITRMAQTALETLVKGESVPKNVHAVLTEKRRIFDIKQGGRKGNFDLSNVLVYKGLDYPRDRVLIEAQTSNGTEYFWLGTDYDDSANFEVICRDEV